MRVIWRDYFPENKSDDSNTLYDNLGSDDDDDDDELQWVRKRKSQGRIEELNKDLVDGNAQTKRAVQEEED